MELSSENNKLTSRTVKSATDEQSINNRELIELKVWLYHRDPHPYRACKNFNSKKDLS